MEDRGSWTSILGRGPRWPPARCGSHGPLKCFAVVCVAFNFPWNAGNHDIAQETGRGATHGGRFASAACPNLVSDRGGNRLKPHTGIISRIERSESELHLTELKPGCQQHSLPS